MTQLLLAISTIFLLIAPISYVVSIIRAQTRPHRLTRLAVMSGLLLTFASAWASNANPGTLLLTGISAIQGVVIFLLSMWRGMGGGKNVFDWSCFLTAIAGMIAWRVSGNALAGMWLAILADCIAYLPAFVKTWQHPSTESHWFYALTLIGTCLTLIAYPIEAVSIFQIYIVACCLVMISLIYRKQIIERILSI